MGVPFEYNLCSFQNVVGMDPDDTDAQDKFSLTAIRRVLLDVMWARELNTAASNWSRLKRDFNMAVGNLSLDYCTILLVGGPAQVQSHEKKIPPFLFPKKISIQISNFSSGTPA
jgi:hypothetical protein